MLTNKLLVEVSSEVYQAHVQGLFSGKREAWDGGWFNVAELFPLMVLFRIQARRTKQENREKRTMVMPRKAKMKRIISSQKLFEDHKPNKISCRKLS